MGAGGSGRQRETLEHEGVLEQSHGDDAVEGAARRRTKEGEGFKASAVGSWPGRLRLRWAEATNNGPNKPTTGQTDGGQARLTASKFFFFSHEFWSLSCGIRVIPIANRETLASGFRSFEKATQNATKKSPPNENSHAKTALLRHLWLLSPYRSFYSPIPSDDLAVVREGTQPLYSLFSIFFSGLVSFVIEEVVTTTMPYQMSCSPLHGATHRSSLAM